MALVQEEIYRMPDRFRLRHVSVQSSDAGGVPPTAAVLMDVDGLERSGAGFGVGPVDALFNVIADLVGANLRWSSTPSTPLPAAPTPRAK